MAAIACLKNSYRSWLALRFAARDQPDKFTRMQKCSQLINGFSNKMVAYCWKKAGLVCDTDLEVPDEVKNIEDSIEEELILDKIESHMACLELPDECDMDQVLSCGESGSPVLIDLESPPKKKKQSKITSYFN